ncbi:MAG: hypothetical protein JST16_04810, partial [Bdellovibrionales bacterium]|nr:hypothetical protein [Bdellovibrionales bacterium]
MLALKRNIHHCPHKFTVMGAKTIFLCILIVSFSWAAPADVAVTQVSASVSGARIRVDGQEYISSATFRWIVGSKHVLEFPMSNEGPQLSALGDARYYFNGWTDSTGLLAPVLAQSARLVITADPSLKSLSANVSAVYLVQLIFYDAPSSTQYSPCSIRPGAPGLVYIDGFCYSSNAQLWLGFGSHIANVIPADGFVFLGINNGPEATSLSSFSVRGPTTITARFTSSKRLSLRTEPRGLRVWIDGVETTTFDGDQCSQMLAYSPGTATTPPMCLGDFDLVPFSKHIITALGQADRSGTLWAFSNLIGPVESNTGVYTASGSGADLILARFVPGTSVLLSSTPVKVQLTLDGRSHTEFYTVLATGSKHSVTAPLEHVDSSGRWWRFRQWKNGERSNQLQLMITDSNSQQIEAMYEALGQLIFSASTPVSSVTIDGRTCRMPCTIKGVVGQSISVSAPPVVVYGAGRRVSFRGETEGKPNLDALSLTFNIRNGTQNVVLPYEEEVLLSATAVPPGSGLVRRVPSQPDGYVRAGGEVILVAEASPGFKFTHWESAATGATNPLILTASSPLDVTAHFDQVGSEIDVTNAAGATPERAVAGLSRVRIYLPIAEAPIGGPDSGTVVRIDGANVTPSRGESSAVELILPSMNVGKHVLSVDKGSK